MHAYRTHTCGALRLADAGATVRLSGWVHRKRDHGQLLFVDLRDHYGLTQCVIDSSSPLFKSADALRVESVVTVTGTVAARSAETVNAKLPTGEIELAIGDLALQSEAETLPFPVNADADYPEEMRLKYRFLDLRREAVHANIVLRSNVIASIRRRMIEQGFTEFQTPILTASTPEGARDLLVPSRLHPGEFYALPQSPQIFKQILMIAGTDRYFQIVRCFRDEDQRADRQLEFTQVDVEVSFARPDTIYGLIEPLMQQIFKEIGREVQLPIRRMSYAEAIARYGSDKPDLRFGLDIHDLSDVFRDAEFRVFKQIVADGGVVRGFALPGGNRYSRSQIDILVDQAKAMGFTGL